MSEVKNASTSAPNIAAHRQLSAHEEDALRAGKSRWMPRIFQSYGTPIPELMASPLKTGLIFGAPAAIVGAGLGSALGGAAAGKNYSTLGGLIGGLGAGGLAAIAAGMDREAKNEGLEELMRRMPEGAAKRDLEADPQYQADFLGWDNNKIVATARARYYRPTERFSKRTDDMADARARYNERHKTSSIHSFNNKDVSMSQSEKQAARYTQLSPAGIIAQARLYSLLHSGILGSVIGGAGGAITSKNKLRGAARGALMGLGTGAGINAGGQLGGMAAGGIAGGLWDRRDPLSSIQNAGLLGAAGVGGGGVLGGIGGHTAGKALADSLVGPAEDEDGEIKKEHKKAAQALLDNTTLTLAEKMAAYKALLEKRAEPATMAGQLPAATGPAMSAPAGFNPKNMQAPMSATTGRVMNDPDVEALLSPPAAPQKWTPPGTIPAVPQNFNVDSTRIDDNKLTQFLNKQLAAAHRGIVGAANGVGSASSRAITAFSDLAKYLKPEPTKVPDPTLFEKLKPYAPYAAVGGAGLGALALADYLSRRNKTKPKKSKREDEEYSMPKAANINWYKVAREVHRQKQAIGLTTATGLPMTLAQTAKLISASKPSLLSRLGALASGSATTAKNLPSWAKYLAGGTAAGGAGLGAYGLLSGGKDPSFLEQIMNSKYTPYAAAGLGTAGLLGGAAYLGSRAGKKEVAKKKKPEDEKQSNFNMSHAGLGAGAGAGIGGLAGGLYGALAPGYEEDPMTGRRRRRSRLMAALRGLAGGAVAGGLGGAALGGYANQFLAPELTDKLEKAKVEANRAYNEVAPASMRSQSANADMEARINAGEEPMPATENVYGNDAFTQAQNMPAPAPIRPRTATPTPMVGAGGATMAAPNLAMR